MCSHSTAIGVFDTRFQAARAIWALRRAGFHEDEISVSSPDPKAAASVVACAKHLPQGPILVSSIVGGAVLGLPVALAVRIFLPCLAQEMGHPLGLAVAAIVSGAIAGVLVSVFLDVDIQGRRPHHLAGHSGSERVVITIHSPNCDDANRIFAQLGGHSRFHVVSD